jgi:glyoxylase-like metal-dependent hydrolase (beta-lactamase superfamily II)
MSSWIGLRTLVVMVAVAAAVSIGVRAQSTTPPDPLVKEGITVRLAEHTYAIPDRNVPLVPNVGIVVGSRAVLVIDPGLGRRNGEAVLREVAKVGAGKDLFVASTHFHAEHTTGLLAFPASAKYVDSTVQEAEFAEGGAQQIALFSTRSPMTAELLRGAVQRKADITFDREYILDLGDVHVRMDVVGPTHTRGDTGLFVEEDRVLFAGDVVMNNSFLAAGAATSMRAWLAAFDTFNARRPRTIVPSHGPVGDGSLILTNRTLMMSIRRRVSELKAEGQPVDDAARTVQQEQQAQHPGWPRANGIAAAARAAYTEAK